MSRGKNKQNIIKASAELVLDLRDLELLNFWVRWQTIGCLGVSWERTARQKKKKKIISLKRKIEKELQNSMVGGGREGVCK